MDLTSLLDLKDLFNAADSGDEDAKTQLQSYRDAPELTVSAKGQEASMAPNDLSPIKSLVNSLPMQRSVTSLVGGPTGIHGSAGMTQPDTTRVGADRTKTPRDWGHIADAVSVGLTDLGRAFGNPRFDTGGASVEGARQRLQAQQIDQLKRRHDMWDTAYKDSQSLPQELLADPNFAGLAQAKAALDKDMMDGKVDNEKNVSGFLTELARHRKDIDDFNLRQKVQDQIKAQSIAQDEMGKAGLLYNFTPEDVSVDPTTGKMTRTPGQSIQVTQDKYVQLNQHRQDMLLRAQEAVARFEATKQARQDATAQRNFVASEANKDRDLARKRMEMLDTVKGVDSLISTAAKQYAVPDKENLGKMVVNDQSFGTALAKNDDALFHAASVLGIPVQQPNYVNPSEIGVIKINGRPFSINDKSQKQAALLYLYQLIRTKASSSVE